MAVSFQVRISWAQNNHAVKTVTVIRAGTLIDGVSNSARRNQVIIIRGNQIVEVSDAATAHIPAGAEIIDLSQATVLPGLIDAHTHIFLQGEDPAEGRIRHPVAQVSVGLSRGSRDRVGAARAWNRASPRLRDVETEGAGYGDVGIKQAIEGGYIPGPRLFVATRAISSTGGYNLEGYAPEIEVPKGAQIVDGPVEARKAAREQLDHGADWIKVYMTHRSWVGKNGELASQPTLTVEELRAIVDEAHGWGKKVACHAYSGNRLAARARRRMRFHRARSRADRRADRADDQAGHVALSHAERRTTTTGRPPIRRRGKRDRMRASAHEAVFSQSRSRLA